MGFDVSSEAANAVLYSVLIFFTLLAAGAGGFFPCLPRRIASFCLLRHELDHGKPPASSAADYFLSARSAATVNEIALSFFASGMGAWVREGLCSSDMD
jgi:solute:Na+ symporter, SSS family